MDSNSCQIQVSQQMGGPFNNKKFDYISEEIDFQIDEYHTTSQISNNEEYLVCGSKNKILKIYYLKKEKQLKEIELADYVHHSLFTEDTSLLFIACRLGYFYGFDCKRNFKMVFRKRIHSDIILYMRTIKNDYLLTYSFDRMIKKTNIKTKQLIFRLRHEDFNYMIEYNCKIDLLILAYRRDFKIWNCMNRTVIVYEVEKFPDFNHQIKLVNNNTQLLSFDVINSNLFKWNIGFSGIELVEIQSTKLPHCSIQGFQSVNQDQNLFCLSISQFYILNKSGEIIYSYQLKGGKYYDCTNFRQLDSLKYIQLQKTRDLPNEYNSTLELYKLISLD